MKKNVNINIISKQNVDGEDSEISLYTEGEFYNKNGNYYISYFETEATGFEGCKTVMKIEGEKKITMLRTGNCSSNLIIEKNKRHLCHYETPYGDLLVGVFASEINSNINDNGGQVSFNYSLDINTCLASENEVLVTIVEA